MNHLRILNVFTLSALLILTGCFGLMPETEADSDSDEYEIPHINWRVESIGIEDNEWMIYYVIYDPTDFLSATGIDYNSDGIVDVQTTNSSGFLTVQTTLLSSNLHPDEYLRVYDMTFIGVANSEVIFSEIFVDDLDEYPEPEEYDGTYTFSAVDSNGAPSTATDDNLIRVTMDQGSDLNWASVSISISVNGAAPITCSNPGLAGADCSAIEFGDTSDNFWSVGDGVTIAESGQDLCAEGTCSVEIRIIDTREGTTIDTTSAIAQ